MTTVPLLPSYSESSATPVTINWARASTAVKHMHHEGSTHKVKTTQDFESGL